MKIAHTGVKIGRWRWLERERVKVDAAKEIGEITAIIENAARAEELPEAEALGIACLAASARWGGGARRGLRRADRGAASARPHRTRAAMGAGGALRRGRLIVLEGMDGCGKTTQARRLAEALEEQGRRVLATREPGGSPLGEQLRGAVLDPVHSPMWETTVLLMIAARAEHLDKTIGPALEEGRWVVCDRMSDSTRAYQGMGEPARVARIEALERWVWGHTPRGDLTVVIDIDIDTARARRARRGRADDRIEREMKGRLATLRASFLERARTHGGNTVTVDGRGSEGAVHARVMRAVSALARRDGGGRDREGEK